MSVTRSAVQKFDFVCSAPKKNLSLCKIVFLFCVAYLNSISLVFQLSPHFLVRSKDVSEPPLLLRIMATLLDSEAQFLQRAKECRLSDLAVRDLSRLGITSFGLLAYSFGQPGQNIADDAFGNWLRQDVNPAITLADSAALKRLLFESHTLVMASLKEQVIAPDCIDEEGPGH